MTRKTAPRAPVCGSDTLGGCKEATPGLGEEEGGLETVKGKKEKEVHPYRPWEDLQLGLNTSELLNHAGTFFYFIYFLILCYIFIYCLNKKDVTNVNSANALYLLQSFNIHL